MVPLPNLSYGSSSGVNGDTKSGPAAEYYFASPFAVGSGASASSDQAGGGSSLLPVIIGGAVAVVVVILALIRRSK